jgi:hypothetical protein
MMRLKALITTCGALAMFAGATPARAALQFAFSDGSVNSATASVNSGSTYTYTVGSGANADSISITPTQNLANGSLSTYSLDINSGQATSFFLYLWGTGYSSPTGPGTLSAQLTGVEWTQGAAGGSALVTLAGYYSDNAGNTGSASNFVTESGANCGVGMGTCAGANVTTSPVTVGGPNSGSSSSGSSLSASSGPITYNNPFSLLEVIRIDFTQNGDLHLDFTGTLNSLGAATPEPASIVLMGTVFCCLVLFLRKRMGAQLLA